MFQLVCENCPEGSQVSFQAEKPTESGPIHLPWTTVPANNPFVVGTTVNVQADYETKIDYEWRGDGDPPPDMKLTMRVSILSAAIA